MPQELIISKQKLMIRRITSVGYAVIEMKKNTRTGETEWRV